MKNFLSSIAIIAIILSSCTNQPYAPSDSQVNVVVEQRPVGLDLQALGELAKNAKNGSDLEEKLNQPGSINNVDLNDDGNVDYLSVVEFGSGNNVGFSITDYLQNNTGGIDTNEVANITFAKNVQTNQVTTNINGNTNLYGSGANSSYSNTQLLTDLILFNYLFSPHSYYYSPYRVGYYPSYYHSYREVPATTYTNTVKKTYTTTTYQPSKTSSSTVKSPYSNKVKSTYADEYKPKEIRSFSNATSSQKSFSVRDQSKPVNTSGFSNKKSSGNSWFSSSPSYTKSSSGGGFKSGSSSGSNSYKSSSSSSYGGFKSGGSSSSYSSRSNSYKSSGSTSKSSGGFKSSSSRGRK